MMRLKATLVRRILPLRNTIRNSVIQSKRTIIEDHFMEEHIDLLDLLNPLLIR
eukprot:gene4397-3198_t